MRNRSKAPNTITVVCQLSGCGWTHQANGVGDAMLHQQAHRYSHGVPEPKVTYLTAPKPTTPRQDVLDQASKAIGRDRNGTYGNPEDNLGRIAAFWSAYLGIPISSRDVAWLMCLLKIAREMHAPHDDNPVDVAGYAAIAHEVTPAAAA